jgi:4a-hydroxytetrahydrobiopterin dehydratase
VAWEERDGKLRQELVFADFSEAFGFLTRVAMLAEKLDHHPDVALSWNRLRLEIVSHDQGRITERCHGLARRIDQLQAGPA